MHVATLTYLRTFNVLSFLTSGVIEDVFPISEVNHLGECLINEVSWRSGENAESYLQLFFTSTLSAMICPTKATSPPGVMSSLVAAVGA